MSVLKNERGKWAVHIVYQHLDGTEERIRRTSRIQTKRAAEDYERQILNALHDGSWQKAQEARKEAKAKPKKAETSSDAPSKDTIAGFRERYFELCEANGEFPGSLENKRSQFRAHLLPLFADRRLDSFTSLDQNELRLRFRKRAKNTYNNAATTLNSVLTEAVKDKLLEKVPVKFETLRRPKPSKDFYEPEQYEEMLAAARRLKDTTAEVAVLLSGEAGCRRGELYPLRWRNCRREQHKLLIEEAEVIIDGVRKKGTPKNGKSRTVGMTDRVVEALGRHWAGRRSQTLVFVQRNGKPFTDHSWRTLMRRVEREAGLKKTTGQTHKYRHTYCSHLAMLGVPILNIKEMAGHATISTTEGYMHLSPASREAAHEKLNNRARLLVGGGHGATLGATPPI